MNQSHHTQLLNDMKAASEAWKTSFNTGNAAGCAAQYTPDAIMHARPFGTFEGTDAIQGFWQKLIEDGFGDVDYLEPTIEVLDDETVLLKSNWKMNKAGGVIHEEIWKRQPDGKVLLVQDDFEVTNDGTA